jgi:ABC-type nitrate/sulfonate/bicarbonate transport system substrate-binding protein
MKRTQTIVLAVALLGAVAVLAVCERHPNTPAPPASAPATPAAAPGLRGTSGYTPYDSFSMLWARRGADHPIAWVNSGADAGRLLVSKAEPANRPSWAFCTQGVVAGLAARGEDVVIIATTYSSEDALRPVFRVPRRAMSGARSLFIPRSSIELAFDRLLEREHVSRADVIVPTVEKTDFATIVSLLTKPVEDSGSIDFAVLVEPFISNVMNEHPGKYELGQGGLYRMYYCVVARRDDVAAHRDRYVALLREFLAVDGELSRIKSDEEFREKVWGREKNGAPERLPALATFKREPLRLALDAPAVRARLEDELSYLTTKYPADLKRPADERRLVDPGLLKEVAPDRVIE